MTHIITIDVTQDDIDNGVRMDCDQCPIARAAQRAGLKAASAGARFLTVVVDGCKQWTALPDEAVEFVRWFDTQSSVAPFSFDIDLDRFTRV